MLKPIYVITTVRKERSQNCSRTRCVGWYRSQNDAVQSIKHNDMDIQECEYTHAVIEETQQGVYPEITKEIWFEWKKKKWIRCPQPKWAKKICNWGIG